MSGALRLRCALTSRGEPRTGAAREGNHLPERPSRQSSAELLVGDLVVEHRSTGVRGVSSPVPGKRGRTHTGTICIPRLEEKVVSHAVYLVCTSVRHLFDGGATGVARGGQRRWRLQTPPISSVSSEASLSFSGVAVDSV